MLRHGAQPSHGFPLAQLSSCSEEVAAAAPPRARGAQFRSPQRPGVVGCTRQEPSCQLWCATPSRAPHARIHLPLQALQQGPLMLILP